MRCGLGVAGLVRAEAQSGTHRRIELAHRPDGAVRESLCEGALAVVETPGGGAKRAVGVRVLLEDAQQDFVHGAPRRRDAHRLRPVAATKTSVSRLPEIADPALEVLA